jgi:hypothetical protein
LAVLCQGTTPNHLWIALKGTRTLPNGNHSSALDVRRRKAGG